MPKVTFTDNDDETFRIEAAAPPGKRVLAYSGDLGGGTLAVSTIIEDVEAPVADAKLSAATLDGNGDAVKQLVFESAGRVKVTLSGATAPNVTVAVV